MTDDSFFTLPPRPTVEYPPPLPGVEWQLEDGLLAWRLAVLHMAICIAHERRALLETKIHAMRVAGRPKNEIKPVSAHVRQIHATISTLGTVMNLLAPPRPQYAVTTEEVVNTQREATIHARAMLMAHRGWSTWGPYPAGQAVDYPLGAAFMKEVVSYVKTGG